MKIRMPYKNGVLVWSISLIVLNNTALAMQVMDDEHMADVTGEGLAFVVEDFNMRWNGANNANGTGYMRFIPVGPLSDPIQQHNNATANASGTDVEKKRAAYDVDIGKGDVFFYGAAISGNDNNITTQFTSNLVDIGTSTNPWLFQTRTVSTPNFLGVASNLSYLGMEAPLLTNLIDTNGALLATDPNIYDLKLGFWADAFVRDSSKVEGDTAQFSLNGATRPLSLVDPTPVTRENRLRLQSIMNGISLHGTSVKLFQTLNGADTASGLGSTYGYYNNTLGLAATVRMNSGSSTSIRAPVYSESSTDNTTENTGTPTAWSNLHGGWNSTLSASQSGGDCNNGSSVTVSTNAGATGCQFMVQSRTRTDSKTRTVTKTSAWTTASGLDDHVMRISTREKGTTQGVLSTPALNIGDGMPNFADTDGLFFYKPNMNLVLGTQWQPLVLGVAADGKNLSLELTRIPNVTNVYKEIYTDYTGADATYKGGTCSAYWCGGNGNGISKNATHSSITVGSTVYTAPVNTGSNKTPLSISAYNGADAAGISFGSLMAVQGQTQTNTGSNTTTAAVTQAQWIQRVNNAATTWLYRDSFASSGRTGTANQWSYNGTVVNALTGVQNVNYSCCGGAIYDYPVASGGGNTWTHNSSTQGLCGDSNCTYYSTINNRNWTFANYNSTYGLTFSTANNSTLDTWLISQGSVASTNVAANQAATPAQPVVAQPSNFGAINLGSAVIDGLLIQHLKVTTTGL